MRELFFVVAEFVAAAIEIAATAMIALAAAQAAAGAVQVFIRRRPEARPSVQRELGGWLVLSALSSRSRPTSSARRQHLSR